MMLLGNGSDVVLDLLSDSKLDFTVILTGLLAMSTESDALAAVPGAGADAADLAMLLRAEQLPEFSGALSASVAD